MQMKIDTSVWFEMSLEVWGTSSVVSYARQEDDVVKVSFECHIEMREFFGTYLLLPI